VTVIGHDTVVLSPDEFVAVMVGEYLPATGLGQDINSV
jgi:hypothetical protein